MDVVPGYIVNNTCDSDLSPKGPSNQAMFLCKTGLGEVLEASAFAAWVIKDLPRPDTHVRSVKFASGARAGVSITFAGSVLRFSLSVTGTQGSLEVGLNPKL